jgi:hypothetical protein
VYATFIGASKSDVLRSLGIIGADEEIRAIRPQRVKRHRGTTSASGRLAEDPGAEFSILIQAA